MQYSIPIPPKGADDKPLDVAAVMSLGRLTFSDNVNSCNKTLFPLGIPLLQARGAFWHQSLESAMQRLLDEGHEFILTLDHDSWFMRGHLERMILEMLDNPQIDALVPWQMKRGPGHTPLFTMPPDASGPRTSALLSEFQMPLTRIGTGHFGLTLIRASALADLPHPWFCPTPDPRGRWETGHTDADISFWRKFAAFGHQAFLSNGTMIGQCELVVAFCGGPEYEYKKIWVSIEDAEAGKIPPCCIPKRKD